jgi:hypothetical protein
VKHDYGVRTEQRLIKEVILAVNEIVKDVNGELMVGRRTLKIKVCGILTFGRACVYLVVGDNFNGTVMSMFKITGTNRKWYEIIMWWELRRIPYNIIMYFIGLLSFQIGYVTIPLIYIVIGFNFLYTLGWIIELIFINRLKERVKKNKYPRQAFIYYLAFSTIIVFVIPVLILIK